jgi:hypothetical protein
MTKPQMLNDTTNESAASAVPLIKTVTGRKRQRTCEEVENAFFHDSSKRARMQWFHDARGSVVVRVIDTEGGEKPVTYVVPRITYEFDVKHYCDWHEDPYCALAKFPDRMGTRIASLLDLWHMFIVPKDNVGEPVCVISIEYERLIDGLDDEDAPAALVDLSEEDTDDAGQQ